MGELSTSVASKTAAPAKVGAVEGGLQRRCGCGQHTVGGGQCAECSKPNKTIFRQAANPGAPASEFSFASVPVVPRGAQSNRRDLREDETSQVGSPAPSFSSFPLPTGAGHPVEAPLRQFMETRFNHDFSGVRLHTDTEAANSAKAVDALAYTVGTDVVFDASGYQPHTPQGLHLLAHELTHVVQQSRNPPPISQELRVEPERSSAEVEADRMATSVLTPGPVESMPSARPTGLSRGKGWALLGGLIGAVVGGLLGALAGPAGAIAGGLAGAALGAWTGGATTNDQTEDKSGTARDRIHRLLTRSASHWVITDKEALEALAILHEVEKRNPEELFEIVMMMKMSGEWQTLRKELPPVMVLGLDYFELGPLNPNSGYVMEGDTIHLEFYSPRESRVRRDKGDKETEGTKTEQSFEEWISRDYPVSQMGVDIPKVDAPVPIVGKSLQEAANLIAEASADPLNAYVIAVELSPVKRGARYGLGMVTSPVKVQSEGTTKNKEALAKWEKRTRFTDLVPYSLSVGERMKMAVSIYYREVDEHLDQYDDPKALWNWAQEQADKRLAEPNKKSPTEEFLAFGQQMMSHVATQPPAEQARTRETHSRYVAWLSKHSQDPKLASINPVDIWTRAYLNIFMEEVHKSARKAMDDLAEKRRGEAWKTAEVKFAEALEFVQVNIRPTSPTMGVTLPEQLSETTGEPVRVGYLITASPAERIIRDKIAGDFLQSVMERMRANPEAFTRSSVKADFSDYLKNNPEQTKALHLTMSHPEVERHETAVDIPTWQTAVEVVVGLIPLVGQVVAIGEVTGGRDLFGHPLTTTERTIIGVGILLPGILKALKFGKGAFAASRVVKEYGLRAEEAARVYKLYTGLGPGTEGAKLFNWGLNEIKAGRSVDDPKVLKQMEKVLQDVGLSDKETARALLPAVERQAEAVAKEEVQALKVITGPISEDTEKMLMKNSPLRDALKESSLAARVLKKCNTPCIPEEATAAQVKRLEALLERLKKVDAYDEEALRQFIYERRTQLDSAIDEVSKMANTAEAAKAKPAVAVAGAGAGAPAASTKVLDVKDQLRAAQRLNTAEKGIVTRKADILGEKLNAQRAREELKVLAAQPKAVPSGLKGQMEKINRLTGEEKIAALDELQALSKTLSEEEKSFLKWRKQTWQLQQDAEAGEKTAGYLEFRMQDLETGKLAAIKELREASRELIDVMRSNGPRYRAKGSVNLDEVMARPAWDALPQPRPPLATDHLVALDRISKLPEVNELLKLYPEASAVVKEEMKSELRALGDMEENLVRMRHDANSGMKSNKSWNDLTYEQAKPFGYTNTDVDKIRGREATALAIIKDKIASLTAHFKAKVSAPPTP